MSEEGRAQSPSAAARIVRVQEGFPRVVLFVGELAGHLEHWKGSEYTFPCDGARCSACAKSAKLFFYAYASAQILNATLKTWEPCVIQLTACAEAEMQGMSLRGSVWELTRLKGKDGRGKLIPRHLEDRDPSLLPAPVSIQAALAVVMGPRTFHLGVPNPFPKLEEQAIYMGPPPAGFNSTPLPSPELASKATIQKYKDLELDAASAKARQGRQEGARK
jgi:hypothetical protein